MSSGRRGFLAVEVLLAALLLVVALVPLMDSFQTSHRVSLHDQRRVLALREARRVAALLQHLPLPQLEAAATGAAVPPDRDPALADGGAEVDLARLGIEAAMRAANPGISSRVSFRRVEAGLGRLVILVEWRDGPHPEPRRLAQALLIEDPEQARRLP